MSGVPVADLGIWKEWIGTIRTERLKRANLVLLAEEQSDNPEILDEVHQRLSKALSDLFYTLHLRPGIETVSRCPGQSDTVVTAHSKRNGTGLIRGTTPADRNGVSNV